MSRETNGPRQQQPDLRNPENADAALIAWDELDEQLLKMLAEDPERGRRLRKLQGADDWLRARAAASARKASPALLECPPAEDLYDFGQGPGGSGLTQARRDAIDRHLATCRECERYVETLTVAPPSPLILGVPDEDEAPMEPAELPAWLKPAQAPVIPMRRRGPRRFLVGAGLAAAAAIVAVVALNMGGLEFPKQERVRVAEGEPVHPVLYPRGHVLMPSAELKAMFPSLGTTVEYWIVPNADASEYRIDFTRHEDGAFGKDLESQRLQTKDATGVAPMPLAVGKYTVKVWAIVNGLDRDWGRRDYDVREDRALEAQLLALRSKSEPKRTMLALLLLHKEGFVLDARNLARTLPASLDRDDFLEQVPVR